MTKVRDEKRIKGREFVDSLAECKTVDDIFVLLRKTFNGDSEKMKERATHVSDSPQIVKLNASIAEFNAVQGKDTRHQDCMNMAAYRYLETSGNTIKQFKLEVNKYATKIEMSQTAHNEQKPVKTYTSPNIELGG